MYRSPCSGCHITPLKRFVFGSCHAKRVQAGTRSIHLWSLVSIPQVQVTLLWSPLLWQTASMLDDLSTSTIYSAQLDAVAIWCQRFSDASVCTYKTKCCLQIKNITFDITSQLSIQSRDSLSLGIYEELPSSHHNLSAQQPSAQSPHGCHTASKEIQNTPNMWTQSVCLPFTRASEDRGVVFSHLLNSPMRKTCLAFGTHSR